MVITYYKNNQFLRRKGRGLWSQAIPPSAPAPIRSVLKALKQKCCELVNCCKAWGNNPGREGVERLIVEGKALEEEDIAITFSSKRKKKWGTNKNFTSCSFTIWNINIYIGHLSPYLLFCTWASPTCFLTDVLDLFSMTWFAWLGGTFNL